MVPSYGSCCYLSQLLPSFYLGLFHRSICYKIQGFEYIFEYIQLHSYSIQHYSEKLIYRLNQFCKSFSELHNFIIFTLPTIYDMIGIDDHIKQEI